MKPYDGTGPNVDWVKISEDLTHSAQQDEIRPRVIGLPVSDTVHKSNLRLFGPIESKEKWGATITGNEMTKKKETALEQQVTDRVSQLTKDFGNPTTSSEMENYKKQLQSSGL